MTNLTSGTSWTDGDGLRREVTQSKRCQTMDRHFSLACCLAHRANQRRMIRAHRHACIATDGTSIGPTIVELVGPWSMSRGTQLRLPYCMQACVEMLLVRLWAETVTAWSVAVGLSGAAAGIEGKPLRRRLRRQLGRSGVVPTGGAGVCRRHRALLAQARLKPSLIGRSTPLVPRRDRRQPRRRLTSPPSQRTQPPQPA